MQRIQTPNPNRFLPLLHVAGLSKGTTLFNTMKHFFSLKALIMGAFLVAILQLQAQEANRKEATPEEALTVHNYAPWEVGLFAGAANAYGDLVDTRFIQFNRTNLAYGGFIRYNASRRAVGFLGPQTIR